MLCCKATYSNQYDIDIRGFINFSPFPNAVLARSFFKCAWFIQDNESSLIKWTFAFLCQWYWDNYDHFEKFVSKCVFKIYAQMFIKRAHRIVCKIFFLKLNNIHVQNINIINQQTTFLCFKNIPFLMFRGDISNFFFRI